MGARDDQPSADERWLGGAFLSFALIVFLAGADLILDLRDRAPLGHVVVELCLVVASSFGAALLGRKLRLRSRAARGEAEHLREQLRATREEAARFRAEAEDAMRGLGSAIEKQFERWELSSAEREVALLLLKGLSHKEIAALRGVSEATARQQGRSIYKKANLNGRHDLAAFFMEDLMLPARPATST